MPKPEPHDGPGTRIQGGVAVVRPGAFRIVSKSGAALLELSRPECGTVVRTQSRRTYTLGDAVAARTAAMAFYEARKLARSL